MPEFASKGYQGIWQPGMRLSGQKGIAIILKRRFTVDLASGRCVPDEVTPGVALMAEYEDEDNPAESGIEQPGELTLEKPKVDVLVKATAYAPGGVPTPEFEVGLRIAGVLDRRLRVIGPRVARWVPPKKWLTDKEKAKGERQEYPPPEFSDPLPIEKLPLRYQYAYGGKAKLVLEAEFVEQAEEHQEEAKKKEARRERKKEIEKELKAEEEKKAAEAKAAAEQEGKSGVDAIPDEVARDKAAEAFSGGHTKAVDAETLERLAKEVPEEELVAVSAYRLGRDLPDRPVEAAPADTVAGEAAEVVAEAAGAAAEKVAGELDGFFSGRERTAAIDISQLEAEGRDEFREALDERARREARVLADGEGTLRSRATEHGDIVLTDEAWVDEHRGKGPAKAAKKEESEFPEMPYPANPGGRGYCVSPLKDGVDGVPLPMIEDPARPLRPEAFVVDLTEFDLTKLPATPGFAAYPPGWFPRAGLAGTMPWDLDAAEAAKLKALEEYDPEDPDDQQAIELIRSQMVPVMQPGFYNEAHPDLQVERIRGDEEVMLLNLTPDGTLYFRLPGQHPKAELDMGAGRKPVGLRLDTLTLDVTEADQPTVEILWRGWHALKDFAELDNRPYIKVIVDDVDQETWLEAQREDEVKAPRSEGTVAIKAIEDEELEPAVLGEEAAVRYREEVSKRRVANEDELGAAKDESGTVIFALDDERQLSGDEWDEEIRADKEAFIEEARRRHEESQSDKEKALRKKARELADAEFGIEREEEGGESGGKGGKGGNKK